MDAPLWPCPGVAEHASFPRLFYYMTVEGVFAPSADTEKGAARESATFLGPGMPEQESGTVVI